MYSNEWQPTASLTNLRQRAELFKSIRHFFDQRNVMEVDTQILSHCAVSDPFIDSLSVEYRPHPNAEGQFLHLQTSPEYAMKRLLASGSGDIYQLGKVFRNGEVGRRHNPEFTMLEWYRLGFSLEDLMDEVQSLVSEQISDLVWRRVSYRELFVDVLQLDPFTASLQELQYACRQQVEASFDDDDRDTWLNLLMSHIIEPQLTGAVFVHSYPPSQAALACVHPDSTGALVSERFELYLDGLELANGYHELANPEEQSQRLTADQQQRALLGLPQRPLERRLVKALEHGLPECSGVALGLDRLLMRMLKAESIAEVIPFGFERA